MNEEMRGHGRVGRVGFWWNEGFFGQGQGDQKQWKWIGVGRGERV
jgi:hypothetical protein